VEFKVNFKPLWVAKKLIDLIEVLDDEDIRRQISFFRERPETNDIARYLFEPLVHRMLAGTAKKCFRVWPLKAMSYEDIDQPTVKITAASAPLGMVFSKIERPVRRFHDLLQCLESGAYYWPSATYHPFFDAFTVEIKDPSDHDIAQGASGAGAGYREVRDIVRGLKTQMRDEAPPAKARKTVDGKGAAAPSVEVRYLLVVPKGGDEGLEWTYPKGWKDCCQRDDHRGKTYCLELPLTVRSTANPEATSD